MEILDDLKYRLRKHVNEGHKLSVMCQREPGANGYLINLIAKHGMNFNAWIEEAESIIDLLLIANVIGMHQGYAECKEDHQINDEEEGNSDGEDIKRSYI